MKIHHGTLILTIQDADTTRKVVIVETVNYEIANVAGGRRGARERLTKHRYPERAGAVDEVTDDGR